MDAARAGGGVSEVFAQGIERNIQRFAQLLADSTADASGSAAASPQDRARAIHVLATMVGGMVLARATAAAQPALSNELMVTLQTPLTDWLEDDTPSPSDRSKKGCQRLFNKHRQPFESHITGGKAPQGSNQAQQASPQAGAPLPTDARRHQAAGRASAASPRTQRYCRRRPFRGSTTTDWPAATGSD